MRMVYQWGAGAHVKTDAQIAGEEMERLRTRHNGRLESKMLVEASRPETAPLHGEFEWDDAQAAESYRQEQAKYLIRHIAVVIDKPNAEPSSVRAFVSVMRDDDRSYTSVGHALSDDELRPQVLRQAWAELEAWRKRYAELAELAKVFSLIDQARPAK